MWNNLHVVHSATERKPVQKDMNHTDEQRLSVVVIDPLASGLVQTSIGAFF